jgi:hypothetical protein
LQIVVVEYAPSQIDAFMAARAAENGLRADVEYLRLYAVFIERARDLAERRVLQPSLWGLR